MEEEVAYGGNEQQDEDDEEAGKTEQRKVRAAAHYHVAKISEMEGQKLGLGVSRQAVAALNELLIGFAKSVGCDVESFARHAKRTVANADDVKLCARRSTSLMARLDKKLERIGVVAEEKKAQRKKNNKRKEEERAEESEAHADDAGEDSNPTKRKRLKKTTASTSSTSKPVKKDVLAAELDTLAGDDDDTEDW